MLSQRRKILSSSINTQLRIIVMFAILRFVQSVLMGKSALLSDSPMYLPLPGKGTFSQVDFWGNLPRPWVVTLPFTLNNLWLIAYFQAILGIVSWTVLLYSISKIQFFQQKIQTALLVIISLIGLSGGVGVWDHYAQSDSIALSGCVLVLASAILVLAGPRFFMAQQVLCITGTIVGGLIRPGIIFLSLLVVILQFLLRNRERQRPLIGPIIGSLLVLLSVVYVVHSNQQMDRSWGRTFAGNPSILGRTMQQVAVINSIPNGHKFVVEATQSITPDSTCFLNLLDTPLVNGDAMAWWLTAAGTCPSEVKQISEGFTTSYAIQLALHPRTSLKLLWPAVTESSQLSRYDSFFVPTWLTHALYGAGLGGPISPFLLLIIMVLFFFFPREKRQNRPLWHEAHGLSAGMTANVILGFIFTIVLSPTDAARIASPFIVLLAVLTWTTILLFIDKQNELRATK